MHSPSPITSYSFSITITSCPLSITHWFLSPSPSISCPLSITHCFLSPSPITSCSLSRSFSSMGDGVWIAHLCGILLSVSQHSTLVLAGAFV
ncbi:hypothetical protein FB451DRAFT_1298707 [Mycena latifolia]|nr:hypothetical protein FB451DRAFT_1298707 [Mycena latifolia]